MQALRISMRPAHQKLFIARRAICNSSTTRRSKLRVQASMELLTPVLPSLLGGLAMGVLATGRLVVSGRVLGISGAVKGLVWGDQSPWRWLFLSGLLSGGVALLPLAPAAFEVMPHTIEPARVLLAGLLVGIGTSLGNGCTSGHGENCRDFFSSYRRHTYDLQLAHLSRCLVKRSNGMVICLSTQPYMFLS